MFRKYKITFSAIVNILGYLGLIPFFFSIILIYFFSSRYNDLFINSFIYYLTIIISFIGATYWGLSMKEKKKIVVIFSVIPSILSWVILSFIKSDFLKLLIFLFLLNLILFIEFFLKRILNLAEWYISLRVKLNIILSICIILVILKLNVS